MRLEFGDSCRQRSTAGKETLKKGGGGKRATYVLKGKGERHTAKDRQPTGLMRRTDVKPKEEEQTPSDVMKKSRDRDTNQLHGGGITRYNFKKEGTGKQGKRKKEGEEKGRERTKKHEKGWVRGSGP